MIYDAPFEQSDLAITEHLSPFCKILHYHRSKDSLASNLYNGLHYYRVCISKLKPSFLRFGKYQIFIKYNSQILTCWKSDHPSLKKTCFNCDSTGHKALDCLVPVLCCICKECHLGLNCDSSCRFFKQMNGRRHCGFCWRRGKWLLLWPQQRIFTSHFYFASCFENYIQNICSSWCVTRH